MKVKRILSVILAPACSMIAAYLISSYVPFWKAAVITLLIVVSVNSLNYLARLDKDERKNKKFGV